MSNTNVLEKPSVNYLEQVLQRAVIDVEFRSELSTHPEVFGLLMDAENLVLPKAVTQQDMLFIELVKEAADFSACASTCVSGYTIKCDGNTIGQECRNTCISGYTVKCDGNTL